MNACTAIVGINWGDEGKGRMVDLLTEAFDVVISTRGGANAGHTVINQFGEFEIHALPSGVFRKGVVNVIGNGVALDPERLLNEIRAIQAKGVSITPENLMISDRASLLLPLAPGAGRAGGGAPGRQAVRLLRMGIAPFYSDKYQKKTILAGKCSIRSFSGRRLEDLRVWKNMIFPAYTTEPVSKEELEAWYRDYCEPLRGFITDTRTYLREASENNKRILFEAQMGALRDLDFGVYPTPHPPTCWPPMRLSARECQGGD